MRGPEPSRTRAAISGAILGALIAVALEALGFVDVLKLRGVSVLLPAALLGALLGATRLRPLLWAAGGALAVTLALVIYSPLTLSLVRPLIRRDSVPPARLDAIAILSAGMNSDLRMSGETRDRLLTGIGLARSHAVLGIMISREYAPNRPGNPGDAADQQEILGLAAPGVPVYFVDSVSSTRDEALRMRALSLSHGWSGIAVVTSPLHTRRACATFEAVGFSVTCVPSAERQFASEMLTGGGDRVRAFRGWVYELAATLKYRSAGWIH